MATNFPSAQQKLAEAIAVAGERVTPYFWRLSGDEPNSLCRILGMEEEELMAILRTCKIYFGEKGNFSKNNFEVLMFRCGCDWTTYHLNQKTERFIKIGKKEGEVVLPKNMYDAEGNLSYYPVEDQHFRTLRTKSQKGSLNTLVELGKGEADTIASKEYKKRKDVDQRTISPNGLLYAFVTELVMTAGRNGDRKISPRAARQLRRLIQSCAEVTAKEILHAAMEKFAFQKEQSIGVVEESEQERSLIASPEKYLSSTDAALLTPASSQVSEVLLVGFEDDNRAEDFLDHDDQSIGSTATDELLSELKEEVVLQSLLH